LARVHSLLIGKTHFKDGTCSEILTRFAKIRNSHNKFILQRSTVCRGRSSWK